MLVLARLNKKKEEVGVAFINSLPLLSTFQQKQTLI